MIGTTKTLSCLEWDRYAARQFNFFFWGHCLDTYHTYKDFTKHKFNYLMIKYTKNEKVFYRHKKDRELIYNYLYANCNSVDFLQNHLNELNSIYKKILSNYHSLDSMDFSLKSNEELSELLHAFAFNHMGWTGGASSAIWVITALTDYFEKEVFPSKLTANKSEIQEYLAIISSPRKPLHYIQEEIDLLKLINSGRLNELDDHVKKYKFTPVYSSGNAWKKEDFQKRIEEYRKEGVNKKLNQFYAAQKEKDKKVEELFAKLNFNSQERELVKYLREFIYYRIYQEYIMSALGHGFQLFFKETAKRFYLSQNQVSFFTPRELIGFLKGEDFDLNELKKREKFSLFAYIANGYKVYTGDAAKYIFENSIHEEVKEFKGILEGTSACPGKVKGRARLIYHPSDLDRFEEGEIMVAANTNPMYVVAMKKAAAIITDEGGITCHAAIVSRELEIPCVTGTGHATVYLKNGDLLEVDAEKGIVKKLEKDEIKE